MNIIFILPFEVARVQHKMPAVPRVGEYVYLDGHQSRLKVEDVVWIPSSDTSQVRVYLVTG